MAVLGFGYKQFWSRYKVNYAFFALPNSKFYAVKRKARTDLMSVCDLSASLIWLFSSVSSCSVSMVSCNRSACWRKGSLRWAVLGTVRWSVWFCSPSALRQSSLQNQHQKTKAAPERGLASLTCPGWCWHCWLCLPAWLFLLGSQSRGHSEVQRLPGRERDGGLWSWLYSVAAPKRLRCN